jgi:hypothetical protein
MKSTMKIDLCLCWRRNLTGPSSSGMQLYNSGYQEADEVSLENTGVRGIASSQHDGGFQGKRETQVA